MLSNLDRYKKDLDSLLDKGRRLHLAIQAECLPDEVLAALRKVHGKKASGILKNRPQVSRSLPAVVLRGQGVGQAALPDRLSDFIRHYEKPKQRKDITHSNYVIEDYLQGLRVTRTQGELEHKVVGPDSAIPQFRQQLAILESVKGRFESSLFDIRQLVQADLFDSELDAAGELAKTNSRGLPVPWPGWSWSGLSRRCVITTA